METKFYVCPVCGNVIIKLVDSGVVPTCCGEKMELLEPNTIEKGAEKHIPRCFRLENCTMGVEVGSVPHPCAPEHYVHFICLTTETGAHFRFLSPNTPPRAVFNIGPDTPVAVYEYCNLHGLWKTNAIPVMRCCTQSDDSCQQ